MASPFFSYVILTRLIIGFHCEITTVSEVSVRAGSSISIPCLYEPPSRGHVKYLCRGQFFAFCSYAVKTNEPDKTGKYSVSDDTNRRIFTVTINDLKGQDVTRHWCAVEIGGYDRKKEFKLSVTDSPHLYVDQQEMTAFEGGSVTVLCHHKSQDMSGWCELGSTCVTEHTGTMGEATVVINDTIPDIYSVTMSGLTTANSGWYFCKSKALQMPVHLMVRELTSTTVGTTITINTSFIGTVPATTQPLFNLTNASSTTNTTGYPTSGGSLQDKHTISTEMMILIIALVSLLLFFAAALIGWRLIKHGKTKPVVPDTCMDSRPENDPALLYATISHNEHRAAQEKNHKPEESVTYSTIVMKDHLQGEPSDGSVIYSTVKPTEK